jgi:hypothetical protein
MTVALLNRNYVLRNNASHIECCKCNANDYSPPSVSCAIRNDLVFTGAGTVCISGNFGSEIRVFYGMAASFAKRLRARRR